MPTITAKDGMMLARRGRLEIRDVLKVVAPN
jgi:hypothetical protein